MSEHHVHEHLAVPADTLAPLVIGGGATLLLAGILMGPIVSVAGILLVVLGIRSWIETLWHEGGA